MVDLVDLTEVKERLGFDFDYDDGALQAMIEEAQDHVLTYIAAAADKWAPDAAPPRIRSAIILAVARLYATRGEDGEVLTPAIKSLLRRDRKPVVA